MQLLAEFGQAKQRAPFARMKPGETASTLRRALFARMQPGETASARETAPFAGVQPGETASTPRRTVPSYTFLFFAPPLGLYESIRPSAECSQAKKQRATLRRALFARMGPGETASTLRRSMPSYTFLVCFRPRWGSMSLSSFCSSVARRNPSPKRNSEHPSPAKQQAPFARL